ncbi:MAG: ATP-binding protein [Deltaproteobacteria bacterium]|nr:ATP-binding protein [Deltaproteobacteria bacterium]
MTTLLSLPEYLNHLRDGVVLASPDGIPIFRNSVFEAMFGGKNIHEAFKNNPLILESFKKAATIRGSYYLHDVPVRLHAGEKKMDVETFPLIAPEGELLAVNILLRDPAGLGNLDEHKKRVDRIHYLATIASGLAHEIKNPLSGIRGASQLLAKSLTGKGELGEYAEIIQKEVARVDALLNDLLHFTKPRGLKKEKTNLNRVIHDQILLQKTVNTGVLFHEEFDPSIPEITADSQSLAQVFLNLLKNARQAIEEKGKISVRSHVVMDFVLKVGEKKRQVIRVDIEDTGSGIPDEDLPNLFTPFFTTKASGTGLGLALCHQIVEEHGGNIRVKSEAGKGTVFSVYLPV